MKIRDNLSPILSYTERSNRIIPASTSPIGKVFGVITTENTPTKELFEANGGFNSIGTIFYLNYDQNTKDIDTVDLSTCQTAKPFHSSNQNYPLVGELVMLVDGPAPSSQLNSVNTQKYYTGTVNIWNNNQQNSPTGVDSNKTFSENADIRNLLTFEGDRIYQGRKGNGLRFGSTVKLRSGLNEWSSVGTDGDPITILVNGYVTTGTGSLVPNIEEINKEKSSIYMTSTQLLPLKPGASIINPVFTSTPINQYSNSSQIILNSDRIVLNTKKDDIILTSSGFIELNTDSIINLNSTSLIHLNIEAKNKDSKILLGTKSDGTVPTEPVLLGGQTHDLLLELLMALKNLAGYLSTAVATSSDGSIPVTSVQDGGDQLFNDVSSLIDKLGKIQSDKVYTV